MNTLNKERDNKMGEAYMGNQHRFRIIGNQSSGELSNILSQTFNPNHALSEYFGYRISREYVNRIGGTKYGMTGPLYTTDILNTHNKSDPGNPPSIGDADHPYYKIYARNFHGTVDIAKQLEHKVNIHIKGAVTGSTAMNGSEANVEINTKMTHNHDDAYLKLTGGIMTGDIKLGGTDSAIVNRGGRKILHHQSDGELLHVGSGPFLAGHGSLNLYSHNCMNMYLGTSQIKLHDGHPTEEFMVDYITIKLMDGGLFISTATDTGIYINQRGELYYRVYNTTKKEYDDYKVYHSGNCDISKIQALSDKIDQLQSTM